jgi:hypothetical protein
MRCRFTISLSEDEVLILKNPIVYMAGLDCSAGGSTTDHDGGDRCVQYSLMGHDFIGHNFGYGLRLVSSAST